MVSFEDLIVLRVVKNMSGTTDDIARTAEKLYGCESCSSGVLRNRLYSLTYLKLVRRSENSRYYLTPKGEMQFKEALDYYNRLMGDILLYN